MDRRLLPAVLLVLPALASVSARADVGVTAAPVLQIPVGARAVGMGSAFTGVADDISALHYNPGGLATLNEREASFMYLKGLSDQDLSYLAFGSPLPFSGLIGSGYSTFGASLLYSRNGAVQVNRTNPDGSFLDSETLNAGQDVVGTLSYAERVMASIVDTPRQTIHVDQFLGVSGKWIRSTLAQQYAATAGAADVGYLLRAPETGWSLGASVLNLGSKMTFVSEGDPLPLTMRLGASWRVTQPGLQTLTLAADGDYLYYERQWNVNTGIEYQAMTHVAARVGYQFHADIAGLTAGIGLLWRGISLDYAWAMSDTVTDEQRFSFTFRFGRVEVAQREKLHRPFIQNQNLPERRDLKEIEQEKPKTFERAPIPRRGSEDSAPGWIY